MEAMKILPYKSSPQTTLGVELEFQIVNPFNQNPISRAKDLIRNIKDSPYQKLIKPEITQSMIEINSSIHQTPDDLLREFNKIRDFLSKQAKKIGICICGGGTHPYQKWHSRKIFPTKRFKNLAEQYRYLSQQATVFGQHIHIGCSNADDALYLTHAFSRYVPQLIAISASSPFYDGIDSGHDSARSYVFSAYPLSGVIPYFEKWSQFSNYFYKLRSLGIVETMKDVYWDIRIKPEFGTIEIRVCDTPLTFYKAVAIAAYAQTLAKYLLTEKPYELIPDLYYLYGYNRFQASRYGLKGGFINPYTFNRQPIYDDILETIQTITPYAESLKTLKYLKYLEKLVLKKENDANYLRGIFKKTHSLHEVVKEECLLWEKD